MRGCLHRCDLLAAVAPLFYLSKLLGLAPYARADAWDGRGRRRPLLVLSRPALAYTGLVAAAHVADCFFYYRKRAAEVYPDMSGTTFVSDVISSCSAFCTSFLSRGLLLAYQHKDITELFASILAVDEVIHKRRRNSYDAICVVIVFEILAFVCIFGVTVFFDIANWKSGAQIITGMAIYFTSLSNSLIDLQFVNALLLMRYYFKCLRSFIAEEPAEPRLPDAGLCRVRKLRQAALPYALPTHRHAWPSPASETVRYSQQRNRHTPTTSGYGQDTDPVFRLRSLRQLHFNLCDIVEQLNAIYGIFIALETWTCLINISFTLYFSAVKINFDEDALFQSALIYLVTWTITYLWKVVGFAVSGHLAARQAAGCAQAAQRRALALGSGSGAAPLLAELERLSQQVESRRVVFTAAGLFRLDLRLVLSVAATATTYFIVLLQFRTSDWPAAARPARDYAPRTTAAD